MGMEDIENRMLACWTTLLLLDREFCPTYMPMDSPNRDMFLENMNMLLGTEIETDWAVHRRYGDSAPHPDGYTHGFSLKVDNFVKDNESFFGRFYP